MNLAAETLAVDINTPNFSAVLNRNVVNFVNVIGTTQADSITGNNQKNLLNGGAGNDSLFGRGGNDTLNGGNGNDRLFGEAGNDTINGGIGNDTVNGGNGNDRLFGQGGRDFMNGGAGNDLLNGGIGNDTLNGSFGNDTLNGGAGQDTVNYTNFGQAVTITPTGIIEKANGETDLLVDVERIVGADGQINVIDSSSVSGTVSLDVDLSLEQLTINGVPGIGSLNFEVENFVDVFGTDQADTIVGDDDLLGNILEGNGGNDFIDGGAENDTLDGGAGDDFLTGGDGDDDLTGGDGNDDLNGDAGNDFIDGGFGNDFLTGGDGDDDLTGGDGDDILVGANPFNFDAGSGESDVLTGGTGADLFILGDSFEAYYLGDSFVTITDFDFLEGDQFQAFGTASDYTVTELNGGAEIFYQGDKIAFVSNTTDVIPSLDFIFDQDLIFG